MDVKSSEMEAMAIEELQVTCQPCDQEGTSKKAKRYCVDCESPYCDTCWKTHNRFPAMRTHVVLNETEKENWKAKVSDKISVTCSEHVGKPVDMFCEDHDQVACSACIAIHHRSCVSVKYIPNIARGTKTSSEYQTLIDSLKSYMENLAKARSSRESYLRQRTNDYDCIEKQIDHYKELLLAQINISMESSKQRIHSHLSETKNNIDHQIQQIDSIINELNNHLKKLNETGNESQLFVEIKETQLRHKHICNSSVDIIKPPRVSAFTFCLDTCLLSRLSVVKVELSKVPKATYVKKIHVKTELDTSLPDVCGIVSLTNGNMCVLDNSNKKLKLLDKSLIMKHSLAFEDYVMGLTVISYKTVAVSVCHLKIISTVEVASELKVIKSFSTEQTCHGICYNKESDDLYVCCGDNTKKNGPGRVKVYDKTGRLKRQIGCENNESSFSTPVNVIFSNATQILYVCDKEKGVIAFAAGRHMLWSFKDPNTVPWGICITSDELILACGPASNHVVLLNRNGISQGHILQGRDGIKTPSSLFFDCQSSVLSIGLYGDHIFQFKLEIV
ncbi:uncharacterized protein LOC127877295 [Dreissena polymorpha]|uniref:B box-type domain-containing protein n=1 Tax=Dreissena polymorpha TaxID=45954 RepID=A0A9D4KI37_DREPO|nr:uncharacterized protein LOC127877295 [Dreissena polymorpha]XP_052278944.1 uncharacterized protein LOC127877295 [Dreissena polymorpha]KAH3839516.1 hypothetical protein DPMN_112947 [Dreissena polymorpha]